MSAPDASASIGAARGRRARRACSRPRTARSRRRCSCRSARRHRQGAVARRSSSGSARASSSATPTTCRCGPGAELIAALGGLHRFMRWPRAMLTDSGGFQVFCLRERRTIDDDGVTFRSHLDGAKQRLTPERAMEIQALLGSDIAMAFDECPPSDAPRAGDRGGDGAHHAAGRGAAWRRRAAPGPAPLRHRAGRHALDLRRAAPRRASPRCRSTGSRSAASASARRPRRCTGCSTRSPPSCPPSAPRYLMGVGTPADIWTAIGAGIDMFDCVMPTRNARNGQLFVRGGQAQHRATRSHRDDAAAGRGGLPVRVLRAATAAPTWPPLPRRGDALLPAGDDPQPRSTTWSSRAARARRSAARRAFPRTAAVVKRRAMAKRVASCSPAAGGVTAATSRRRCSRCSARARGRRGRSARRPTASSARSSITCAAAARRRAHRATRASRRRASRGGAGAAARASCGPDAIDALLIPGGERRRRPRCPTTPRSTSSARSIPTSSRLLRALLPAQQADGVRRACRRCWRRACSARWRACGMTLGPKGTPAAKHAAVMGADVRPVHRRGRDRRSEGARLHDARLPGRGARRCPAVGQRPSIGWCARRASGVAPRIARRASAPPEPRRPPVETTGPSRGCA